MKSKKNTYFLIPVALLIWGFIGYKIYASLNSNNEVEIVDNNAIEFEPEEIKEVEEFTINANYRDPFLGKLYHNEKKSGSPVKKIVKPTVVFPVITYNGMVDPKEADRATLFLITINNKQQFLSVGKQIDSVMLLKGNSKEITIGFQNNKKTIPIQQ
ncbi:MAG: hypothetical protein WC389_04945 [Lutibacter sp.]|jgi:hypothetical protein